MACAYRLIHGDSLSVLRDMKSNAVDFILTDPPYGVNFQSERVEVARRREKIANDKTPFVWWLYDSFRVLKDGGGMLCFSRWDVQQTFMDLMKVAGYTVKSVVVWDKMHHGMGDLKSAFSPCYETVIFAIKGKYVFPGKRPKDIIRVQRKASSKLTHPNEKPVALMRELLKSVTLPGQRVLDPFAGSGAAGVAAIQLGRKYIGVELDDTYARKAALRLRKVADRMESTAD